MFVGKREGIVFRLQPSLFTTVNKGRSTVWQDLSAKKRGLRTDVLAISFDLLVFAVQALPVPAQTSSLNI